VSRVLGESEKVRVAADRECSLAAHHDSVKTPHREGPQGVKNPFIMPHYVYPKEVDLKRQAVVSLPFDGLMMVDPTA
jgi:hypothetical protein